jgi:uncharacterized membrane protein
MKQIAEKLTPKRKTLRRFVLTGMATLLPTVLTGYILFIFVRFIHDSLGHWIGWQLANALDQLGPNGTVGSNFAVAGTILAVALCFVLSVVVGFLALSFMGKRMINIGEHLLLKVPLVRVIYPYVKQVTDFLLTEKSLRFHTVVAVEYPRRGIYSIGFVTGQGFRTLKDELGDEMINVFIPSSPTPITGYVIFVRRSEAIDLPVTVDQALRFAISGGVIVPPHELVQSRFATAQIPMGGGDEAS